MQVCDPFVYCNPTIYGGFSDLFGVHSVVAEPLAFDNLRCGPLSEAKTHEDAVIFGRRALCRGDLGVSQNFWGSL